MSGQVLNEGVYNENYKKTHDIEKIFKFIGLIILIGAYKSKTQHILQLRSKDGHPLFNKIMNHQRF